MITAELITISRSGVHCSNKECKHSPELHFNILGSVWHLKQDKIAMSISIHDGDAFEIYCKDCIDIVYQDLRKVMDKKLWILH